jgi:dTDP-4-dehydrorhamnose reductase
MSQSLVIFGAGYTARFVLPLVERHYSLVLATSREPDRHLSHIQPDRRIRFDLVQQVTWKNIPMDADLLWCFPAEPPDLVQEFAAAMNVASRRLVVLGSTSAYPTSSSEYPPPWIDETAPIDLTQPRVRSEEHLRTHCAATVLRVAGIYGPGRSPIDWIRKGRVGSSRKYVNLIHVEDLASVCLTALDRGIPSEVYNVSDGTPRTWTEICRRARDRWGIQSAARSDEDVPSGKRIANGKLLAMLQSGQQHLRYPDLWSALDQLVAPSG